MLFLHESKHTQLGMKGLGTNEYNSCINKALEMTSDAPTNAGYIKHCMHA